MNLEEKLSNKKLYFTVTTGRSGTAFLAEYLENFDGVHSVHEPVPQFHPIMRKVLNDAPLARNFWLSEKIPAILMTKSTKYVETSHLICKGFLEPLFDMGVFPNLILLRRDKREVAKSLFFLNTIPGRSEAGLKYYLKPDDKGVLLPISEWQKLTDYQLCYWYTLEIEKRQKFYAEVVRSKGGKILDVDFEKLLAGKLFDDLADFLEVNKLSLLRKMKLRIRALFKVNAKTRRKMKKSLTHSVNYKQEEKDLAAFL